MKILANDGIDAAGKKALENAGFKVSTDHVPQDQLAEAIRREGYVGLLVRSATTVRRELIDQCRELRFIGRGGVGMDNIDADYARSCGIEVFNTPGSSSASVAELVMALMFAAARFTFAAGHTMPRSGATAFAELKKSYSKGTELSGKTLGIVGFGRIGQALAACALGSGMKVIVHDKTPSRQSIPLRIEGYGTVDVPVSYTGFDDLIRTADYISLHVPKQPDGRAVISGDEITRMKKGVVLVNTSRGGVVDEKALLEALESGQVRNACLDVFVGEPHPNPQLLAHPHVISTPHIGASTAEAQGRIGLEIAERVCAIMGVNA